MSDTAQAAIQRVTDTLYAPVRYTGSGTPEGVVTSAPGWVYQDTADNTLYFKETGTGNTGWSVLNRLKSSGLVSIPSSAGSASAQAFTHGLGGVPDSIRATFICQSADVGYSIGDEVALESLINFSGNPPFTLIPTPTTVGVSFNSNATIYVANKSSGVFAAADHTKWLIKICCVRFPT